MDYVLSDLEGMQEKEAISMFLSYYETSDLLNEYEKEKIISSTLEALLEEKKEDPWKFFTEDYIPLLDGLVYSYERGFIHRDIKPSNIYLDQFEHDGEMDVKYVLGDFGSSKIRSNQTKTKYKHFMWH